MPDGTSVPIDVLQTREPKKEFCLTEADIVTCEKHKDWIWSTINGENAWKFKSSGITWDIVMPVDIVPGKILVIKKPRPLQRLDDLKKGIQNSERELLEMDVVDFAPTYYDENLGLFVQVWLKDDKNMPATEKRERRDSFIEDLNHKGLDISNPRDNIRVTKDGPGIIDVMDCSRLKQDTVRN